MAYQSHRLPGRRWSIVAVAVGLLFLALAVAKGHTSPIGSDPANELIVPTSPAEFSRGLLTYLSPLPGAKIVSPETTIALRPMVGSLALTAVSFQVRGQVSGLHSGQTILADDQMTIIFRPDESFAAGETVDVAIRLQSSAGAELLNHSFEISGTPAIPIANDESLVSAATTTAPPPRSELLPGAVLNTTGRYFTAPADFPIFDVYHAAGVGDGFVFVAYFSFMTNPVGSNYLLILDDNGQPVFYDPGSRRFDFKKQPNGLLTYYDGGVGHFLGLDQSYNIVDEFAAGNGYSTNVHDLQLLDNDHFLLTIYDSRQIDMSQIVPGGDPNAIVIGCIIQELDTARNVVFEWRSWDHISILDSNQDLTTPNVDYIHCNSIGQDTDGHLLMSSRHLDEVTKINRQTGQIIWRLGGVGNQFDFTNDDGFDLQHDARRLANGNLTIFDNGTGDYSRGVEYLLDEINMTATRVWQYRNDPDTVAFAMGSNQRLPSGNAFVGWGTSNQPMLTEAQADGTKVFEISAQATGFTTYRAFRFPWQGFPTWPPVLFARQIGSTVELYFSWNGATEVAAYDVYAGPGLVPTQYIANLPRHGFETRFDYQPSTSGIHTFRVVPRDLAGQAGPPSNVFRIIVDGRPTYLPLAFQTSP